MRFVFVLSREAEKGKQKRAAKIKTGHRYETLPRFDIAASPAGDAYDHNT
jgi:hypothetical protein